MIKKIKIFPLIGAIMLMVTSCYNDDIEVPEAVLKMYAVNGSDTTEITDGSSVAVGTEVVFESTNYTDYGAIWPGDRGPVLQKVDGTDSTDVLGNPIYDFSHRYEDYGLTNARGFNMVLSDNKVSLEYTGYSYSSAGTYTVTLIVGNYGRYETGVEYDETTRQITVTE